MTTLRPLPGSTASRRFAAAALAAALVLAPALAEARIGGGSSFGSRGSRTFSAPPSTSTAPRSAAPMERSMTQPSPGSNAFRPAAPAASGGLFGGMFGRGMMGGLLGGLVGAGLLGMLFGHGLFGGLGGLSSILGLVIQLGLLFLVIRFAMNWFARRQQPGFAGAAPMNRTGFGSGNDNNAPRSTFGGLGGGLGGGFGSAQPAPVQTQPLTPEGADFEAFEKRLVEAQAAYTAEDLEHIRRISTPEMASYFAEQIADNAKRGVINKVSDVRLEQGDLAEAWREGDAEYATVAMRYSLIDATYERAGNRLVEGDAQRPQEVTELWTFRRNQGAGTSGWLISGIQQS
jgi:predicted lipid-binding transport protein (Tim44 family)